MAFNADKSKRLVVIPTSRRDSNQIKSNQIKSNLFFSSRKKRDLASSLSHIEFRIDGRKMETVSSYSHLGHISSSDGDSLDIMKQKRAFNGQINNMLCFLGSSRP